MTPADIKKLAVAIAISNCTRVMFPTGVREIEKAMNDAYGAGFGAGLEEGRKLSARSAGYPAALQTVDWKTVVKEETK